jgi:hypothetical protein
VSEPTVLSLLDRASTWLRPEYEKIVELVRSSDIAGTDQTSLKVDGVNYWIWAFTTDSEVLYTIRPTKGKKVLEEVLGEWKGTLVCDGLRSHHTFAKKTGARIQRCWAHLLVESENLAEKCREAADLNRHLHALYGRLVKLLEGPPPPEGRERAARNAKRAMRRLIGRQYKSRRAQKFLEKIRRGYPYWFTFITTPGVEPTNNTAENALRELVVQRKIRGTLSNGKGAYIYETLMTLLSTRNSGGST